MNLDDAPELAASSRDREIVAIDDALEMLAKVDPPGGKIPEPRDLSLSFDHGAVAAGDRSTSVEQPNLPYCNIEITNENGTLNSPAFTGVGFAVFSRPATCASGSPVDELPAADVSGETNHVSCIIPTQTPEAAVELAGQW